MKVHDTVDVVNAICLGRDDIQEDDLPEVYVVGWKKIIIPFETVFIILKRK